MFAHFNVGLMMLSAIISCCSCAQPAEPVVISQAGEAVARVPLKPIVSRAIEVVTPSLQEPNAYYALNLWISRLDQYLVYAEFSRNQRSFTWEVVPYERCSTMVGRVWQQLKVLWRITFGGWGLSEARANAVRDWYLQAPPAAQIQGVAGMGTAFSDPNVIQRQRIFEGQHVDVLYNYSPVTDVHLLIVPKQEHSRFTDLTREEYTETMQLVQHAVDALQLQNVFLMHKTGRDAGQTQRRWHLHAIATGSQAEGWWGRLMVLKKILFGGSPLPPDELARRVQDLSRRMHPAVPAAA